ncbi:hypothetical protein WP8W19C03_10430 [Aeromonas veronii]|jgi:transcriptional regulator with XRE-family HTH domain|uniref:helix-turn-helix domain-containing protein n=1 Tax=Pseudomonadota TaxID=1224 RepID=UPI000745466C|nr:MULTISPECIES: helix-turn-helix transcriptional regulator [Pseudomonadota]EMD6906778.1 helix-turn-helix transcriptional regulator [Citrobacter freundii]MBP6726661.1 helix-turn-helix transcriptional regulator [Thauera sp.]HCW3116695.1 helix-turn-helix transcriptional regulator [Citrobacter amalonaticus]MCH4270844.1 helix-turn-helix domain-containing protein [Kerstersia gyiorum]MCI1227515.1 helix-turn-helix domain-containing protein [Kerstersia gyiorum]
MTIGCRLKEERKRLRLNQTDFAALAGVQISAQTNYENDKRQPDAKYLAAIAEAGADVGYITTGVRKGEEHTTPAAQLLRMKVLASLLADELHKRETGLSEVGFHELLDELWPEWSADATPEPAALRERIAHALSARGVK